MMIARSAARELRFFLEKTSAVMHSSFEVRDVLWQAVGRRRGSSTTVFSHTRSSNPSRKIQQPNALVAGLSAGQPALANSHPTKRLKVAVDVDEVLGRFLVALNGYCKETHDMDFRLKDYWVYEFAKIWGCTEDHSNHIVHEFFKSSHFRRGIPVMPGAFYTLQELSTWCDLEIVTSRQHVIEDETLEWISEHYPNVFQSVHFGNHFSKQGVSKKKSSICRDIGADVLIDDNPSYAIDCASHGIHVILYNWHGGYPWSMLPKGEENPRIQQACNWLEVKIILQAIKSRNLSHV